MTELKRQELLSYVNDFKPNIICIVEAYQKFGTIQFMHDCEFFKGYNSYWPKNLKRGTVIFIKNTIPVLKILDNDTVDCLGLKILLCGLEVVVGIVYRSPSTDDISAISAFIDFLCFNRANTIIFGDFNLPGVDWNRPLLNNKLIKLLKSIAKFNLKQIVTEYTRFRVNQKPSLLDLCLISDRIQNHYNIRYFSPVGKSDHSVILLEWHLFNDNRPMNTRKIKNWNKVDSEGVINYLNSIQWETVMGNLSPEQMSEFIERHILFSIENYVPDLVFGNSRPRLSIESKFLLKLKLRNWRKYLTENSTFNLYNYIDSRRQFKKSIARDDYINSKKLSEKCKKNSKMFWSQIRTKMNSDNGIQFLKEEDQLVSDPVDIANKFNQMFKNVFTKEIPIDFPLPNTTVTEYLTDIPLPSEQDIRKIIENLRDSKTIDPLKINVYFLKKFREVLVRPMTILYRKCITDAVFPAHWKIAHVIPLHKDGSKDNVSNYRPISLTSVIGKILERYVYFHLENFFIKNKLIDENQFGFKNARSVCLQLLVLKNYLEESLSNNESVDVIYLDFRKAFDAVPHQKLIKKLECYGIGGNCHKFLSSFLLDRTQCVKIRNVLSNHVNVTSGVPQGSVLGPLLFSFFISDLTKAVKNSQTLLFADDTKLFNKVTDNGNIKLQEDLFSVSEWCKNWQIDLNYKKCKCLHFGKENPKLDYYFDKDKLNSITNSTSERDLGVIFESDLLFEKHIDTKILTCTKLLGFLKFFFKNLDATSFVNLYISLIRPHLEFCSPVWNRTNRSFIVKIEKIQRKATKIPRGLSKLSYEDRLKKLNLPTLEFRRLREDIITIFKICKLPFLSDQILTFKKSSTRGHNLSLFKQRYTTKISRGSISNRVFEIWNKLPNQLPTFTLNQLKSCLSRQFGARVHSAGPFSVVGAIGSEPVQCSGNVPVHGGQPLP
jgi:hypothetical protein